MIISTTITNSRADVIGEALTAIAPEVGACLVIDTGATDDTMQIAAQATGSKLVHRVWPWRNDFAAARNYALDEARAWLRWRQGDERDQAHNWIVTADTDEWLRVPDLGAFLLRVPADRDAVLVPHASRTYRQVRAVRATCPGRWSMPVHEYFAPYSPAEAPPNWEFACQPRPTEDRTAKYTHYRAVLSELVEREPANARAWYYLGDTCAILGYKGAAIRAFEQCSELPGQAEQAAWACWRAAILQVELGVARLALGTAGKGIGRAPHVVELYWLSGRIFYQLGSYASAAACARYALNLPVRPRPGFCFPRAQRELPEQLLRYSEARLAGRPLESDPLGVVSPASGSSAPG